MSQPEALATSNSRPLDDLNPSPSTKDNSNTYQRKSKSKDKQNNTVRVLVRVRPQLDHEKDMPCTGIHHATTTNSDKTSHKLTLNTPQGGRPSAITRKSKIDMGNPNAPDTTTRSWEFKFDGVIGESQTQQDVFEQGGVEDMVDRVLDGFHATVFAYGQTGSGKTYSMDGLQKHHQCRENREEHHKNSPRAEKTEQDTQAGIVPRAIKRMFERIKTIDDVFSVQCSSIQIHNETVFDLLSPDKDNQPELSDNSDSDSDDEDDTTTNKNSEIKRDSVHDAVSRYTNIINASRTNTKTDSSTNNSNETKEIDSVIHATNERKEKHKQAYIKERKQLSEAHAVRWLPDRGFFVANLTTLYCCSAKEGIQHFRRSSHRRSVAAHGLNNASSRSHLVFTIHVQRFHPDTPDEITRSRFTLVDLAGSERAAWTGASGERLKEATLINQSLFALRKVIVALTQQSKSMNQIEGNRGEMGSRSALSRESTRSSKTENSNSSATRHVPYRDSKLTSLLQHSLGGSSYALMIACVSPCDAFFEENLSTLTYASRASTIRNTPIRNTDPRLLEIQALKRQVTELQRQLIDAERLNQIHLNSMDVVDFSSLNSELSGSNANCKSSDPDPGTKVSESTNGTSESAKRSLRLGTHGQLTKAVVVSNSSYKSGHGNKNEVEMEKNSEVVGVLRERLLDSVDMVKSLHRTQMRLRSSLEKQEQKCETVEQTNTRLMQENAQLREREQVLLHVALGPAVLSNGETENEGSELDVESIRPLVTSEGQTDIQEQLKLVIRQLRVSRLENDEMRDRLEQSELVNTVAGMSTIATTSNNNNISNGHTRIPARNHGSMVIKHKPTQRHVQQEVERRTNKKKERRERINTGAEIASPRNSFPRVGNQQHQHHSPRVERVWPSTSSSATSRRFTRTPSPVTDKNQRGGNRLNGSFRRGSSSGRLQDNPSSADVARAVYKRNARTSGSNRGNTNDVSHLASHPPRQHQTHGVEETGRALVNPVGHLSVSDLKSLLGGRKT